MIDRILAVRVPASFALLSLILSVLICVWAHPAWALPTFVFSVMLSMDVRARAKDYLRILPVVGAQRFPAESWPAWSKTRCSRDVMLRAYAVHGHGHLVRIYHRALGYRWWHFLPDGTFSRQSPYKRWSFWKAALGL